MGETGKRLRAGFVAIVGRPNVGKSTLLNRLLGERVAIVTAKPQTTRTRILGVLNGSGFQMALFDTPGLHRARGPLNRRMVETALATLREVDVVLLLVEAGTGPGGRVEVGETVRWIADEVRRSGRPAVLGINKMDRAPKETLLPVMQAYGALGDWRAVVPFSARDGENVDRLVAALAAELPEGDAPLEGIRDLLAEKCQLLRALRIENLGPAEGARRRDVGPEPAGVVAIGASAGGPQAIQRLLSSLPRDLELAFVVAQHMPERFTAAFADRLARTTPFSVSEAEGDEVVAAGRVLVAPGGRHLEVRRDGGGVLRAAVVAPGAAGGGKQCPSADLLFASVARAVGSRSCGVVLTGMGQDGRAGVAAIRLAGGLTLAESEDSAVVYGMPQAAAESGAVDEVLSLPALVERITRFGGGH
jgi:small GTP-binding protein